MTYYKDYCLYCDMQRNLIFGFHYNHEVYFTSDHQITYNFILIFGIAPRIIHFSISGIHNLSKKPHPKLKILVWGVLYYCHAECTLKYHVDCDAVALFVLYMNYKKIIQIRYAHISPLGDLLVRHCVPWYLIQWLIWYI